MPEKRSILEKLLINDSDEDHSEEGEGENGNSENSKSRKERICKIVHDFFKCKKFSSKYSKVEADDKKLMSKNVRGNNYESYNAPQDRYSGEIGATSNRNGQGETNERRLSRNDGNEENIRLLNGKDAYKVNGQRPNGNDQSEYDILRREAREVLKNTRISGNTASSSDSENTQGSNSTLERVGEIFTGRSISVYSESEYDRIREGLRREKDGIFNRLSSCNVQRSFSEDNSTSSSKMTFSRFKKFVERNVRKLSVPHLHSGSVLILNKSDTNVKFTPLQSDIEKVVDELATSRNISNPNLLSGGQVVFEEVAHGFKPLNFYADDPIVFELPEDFQIPETSAFTPPSTETRVFARSFSGGGIIDDSSKCVSLPELFPSKNTLLEMNTYRPSVQRHLSGGNLVKSNDAANAIFMDLLSKSIKLENVETSQPSALNDHSSVSEVNSPSVNSNASLPSCSIDHLSRNVDTPEYNVSRTNPSVSSNFNISGVLSRYSADSRSREATNADVPNIYCENSRINSALVSERPNILRCDSRYAVDPRTTHTPNTNASNDQTVSSTCSPASTTRFPNVNRSISLDSADPRTARVLNGNSENSIAISSTNPLASINEVPKHRRFRSRYEK